MTNYCGYCNVKVLDYGLGLCMDCLHNYDNIKDEMYVVKGIAKKYKCVECKDTGVCYKNYACSECFIEPTEEEIEIENRKYKLQQQREKELLKHKQREKELLKKKLQQQKNKGIVYLIQPATFVGTNYYKIGMSNKETIDRIKSYKLDTRVLCIYNCEHPEVLEKKLLKHFKEEYKIIKGKEYFDTGRTTETILQQEFMGIINDYQEEDFCHIKESDCHHCNYTGRFGGEPCWFC